MAKKQAATSAARPRIGRPPRPDAKRAIISFRAEPDLLGRLDAHIARLRAQAPGAGWSRSTAALNLILRALDQVEQGQGAAQPVAPSMPSRKAPRAP